MIRGLILVVLLVSVSAFAPVGRVSSRSMSMKLEGAASNLVGTDLEYPEFDPWGFSKTASEDQMFWYRAAELKHARVAMLASLGQIFAYFWRLNDPVFSQGDKPLKALEQVFNDRPLAAVQVIGFIFAAEVMGQFNQVKPGQGPGDLGFDPLGLKPTDPETWEKVQLRELKNGRLAMLGIAGMLYTEYLTGNGPLEAWKIGAISPFNDGIGIF